MKLHRVKRCCSDTGDNVVLIWFRLSLNIFYLRLCVYFSALNVCKVITINFGRDFARDLIITFEALTKETDILAAALTAIRIEYCIICFRNNAVIPAYSPCIASNILCRFVFQWLYRVTRRHLTASGLLCTRRSCGGTGYHCASKITSKVGMDRK